MEIIAREEGKTLLVSFPFDLKDAFKEIFKTAKWNPERRSWCVSNSKINHNKLEVFREKSQQALGALRALEDQEATKEELAKLEARLVDIESKAMAAIKSQQEFQVKLERIIELKAKIEHANTELINAQKADDEAKTAVNKIIQDQVKKYDIDALIGRLIHIRKQYSLSEHRKKFGSIQNDLLDAHDKILNTTGIDLKALQELYDEDYRKTNAQNLFFIARDLYKNHELVEPEATES
ncbi:hypothetical protein [Pseudomonas aeruginosa]|uniref:hypothetical protein n=1 Tax=Pseudomonas aeruginosa TaxID=287 RepID=UPI0022EBDB15|nr:hypothetical protein [Pseudomonas aeruginosa]